MRLFNYLAAALIALLLPANLVFADTAQSKAKPVNANVQYSVGMIKSCGVALAVGNKVEETALKDAQKKAVKKAAARFIAPSSGADSLYQQIVFNYEDYIDGAVKVIKKQKVDGKVLLFCDVPVNFQRINEYLKQQVQLLQKQNRKDKAIFLVRVSGVPSEIKDEHLDYDVLTQYEEAFKIYNFKALGSDTAGDAVMQMLDTVKGMDSYPTYEDYKKNIIAGIVQIPEISLAVIGEIKVIKTEKYQDSAYAEVHCNVEVVKLEQDNIMQIGSYNDNYSANRESLEAALQIVTQAAAVKSSKYLSDITYGYWQSHK